MRLQGINLNVVEYMHYHLYFSQGYLYVAFFQTSSSDKVTVAIAEGL
jgi:hypothetical protein